MALVQRRELSAAKLAGRSIYQEPEKKRTIYSNIYMKNVGYVINDENAADYYNYSLRTIESIFGAAVVTIITSKLWLGLALGATIHLILSLLFYCKFLKRLPKVVKFEKYKKDNYVKSMSKDITYPRLILVIILTFFTCLLVIYAKNTKDYSLQIKNLLIALHIIIALFAGLNIVTLVYKVVKKPQ